MKPIRRMRPEDRYDCVQSMIDGAVMGGEKWPPLFEVTWRAGRGLDPTTDRYYCLGVSRSLTNGAGSHELIIKRSPNGVLLGIGLALIDTMELAT